MKMLQLLIALLFFSSLQSGFSLRQSDEGKITHIINEYVDAWNNSSGRGFARHYSSDSHFINIFGMHFHGKEAIEDRHIEILDTCLKDSTFSIVDIELREISSNLVLATVSWKVEGFHKPGTEQRETGETITGVFSHIFINENDSWEITASQNTLSK